MNIFQLSFTEILLKLDVGQGKLHMTPYLKVVKFFGEVEVYCRNFLAYVALEAFANEILNGVC